MRFQEKFMPYILLNTKFKNISHHSVRTSTFFLSPGSVSDTFLPFTGGGDQPYFCFMQIDE
jgi:hypothetical protein